MSELRSAMPHWLEATYAEVYEASLKLPGFGQGQTDGADLTPGWNTDDGQYVKVNFWVERHQQPVRDSLFDRYGLAAQCVFGATIKMTRSITDWPAAAYTTRQQEFGDDWPLLPVVDGDDTVIRHTRILDLALDARHGVSWWESDSYQLVDEDDNEVLDEQCVELNEFDAACPPTEDTGTLTPRERRAFKTLESRLAKSDDAPQDPLLRIRLRQWLAVSDLIQYSELFEHNQFFVPLQAAFDKE